MRKALKIVLAIVTVIIILFAAFAALIFLDLSAYTATGSTALQPSGASVGNALVLYDPGYSGASTRVAQKVADDLQAKNYTVTLAGIKSSDAANTAGYSIIVVGGPIYAGTPTASVKDELANLNPGSAKVGVFGSGQGPTSPEDIAQIKSGVPALSGALSNAVIVKIGEGEDLDVRAADFVSQLTA